VDGRSDLLAVEHSKHDDQTLRDITVGVRRYLKHIDPKVWEPDRLQWLWEQVLKEDYATDDLGAATPELFISNLFLPNSEHYEYGDDGYVAVLNILRRINADVHFAVWGDVSIPAIIDCHGVIADHLFESFELNRLTAYVPSFNKKMVRFCTLIGYKYEGEIREIFLKNGTYHSLFVYGLLKRDYVRRKKV
jgi:hypothetical protein